ncbi:MAG: histidine phosphatase family protein [Prevotella sp.]|nr:histidine phosphatase family protein [Prevotella sp.]
MSSVSKPRVRQNRHKQGLNQTLEKISADFRDYIREHYQGKTVLAVGHGIINKAIQSVYTGKPMNEIQKMANCEVRVLEL